MANVFRMGEEARRTVMSRLALRHITQRQKALRRSWHQLSRAEVGAELIAIGQGLLAAAPLFLPSSFDSGGALVGRSGMAVSRNGKHDRDASGCASHDRMPGGTAWEELVRLARQALSELECLLHELSEDAHQTLAISRRQEPSHDRARDG